MPDDDLPPVADDQVLVRIGGDEWHRVSSCCDGLLQTDLVTDAVAEASGFADIAAKRIPANQYNISVVSSTDEAPNQWRGALIALDRRVVVFSNPPDDVRNARRLLNTHRGYETSQEGGRVWSGADAARSFAVLSHTDASALRRSRR